VPGPLTPRARTILEAVEREVAARLAELESETGTVPPRRSPRFPRSIHSTRPSPELLVALELAVAGLAREEVAAELGVDDGAAVLDAVFGPGSAPRTRLPRAA
jgi:hypothetical protein